MVDDDPTNLEVLRVRLSAQGYEVVAAVDGEDALRRARELKPDLVLLDVMMPKLDGISVLKELKGEYYAWLHTRYSRDCQSRHPRHRPWSRGRRR